MKNKKKHIKYILKNFDFKRTQRTMELLNWSWVLKNKDKSDFEANIPSIKQLKATAKNLLKRASKEKNGFVISTGGFWAYKHKDFLELKFVVTDMDSSWMEEE